MKKIIIVLSVLLSQLVYSISPPTGSTDQHFCQGESWTLEDVIVNTTESGLIITWFAVDDNTSTPLSMSTNLDDGTTYYAFQNTGVNAESLAVTVHFDAVIPAPTNDNDDPLPCFENYTLADLPVFNTTGFTSVLWFSSPNTSFSPLPSDTPLVDGVTYYAFQGIGGCAESLEKTIHLGEVVPAPTGESEKYYCEGEGLTIADLIVFNTTGFDQIYFFDDENQSNLIPNDTPLADGVTYYAFQGICGGDCSCFISLPVTVYELTTEVPTGDSDQYFNSSSGITIADLVVFATISDATILFFDTPDCFGTLLPLNTPLIDGITYFAFQSINDCCVPLAITVHFTTVGLDDYILNSTTLYPNPVKNTLTIKINNQTNIDLIISDIHGRKVYKEIASVVDNVINVNVSNLNSGVYFISLITGNHKSTKKFVKK